MSYNIQRTDGTSLVEVINKSIDTTTCPIGFIGSGAVAFGDTLNENQFHILENFANTTSPAVNPPTGMLWFSKTDQKLKVNIGTPDSPDWDSLGGVTVSGTEPSNPTPGQLWYDQTSKALMVWDGSVWKPIGGSYTITTDGAGTATINIGEHNLVAWISGEQIIGVVSDSVIAAGDLPSTISIEDIIFTFASRFPNGIRAGITLASGAGYVLGGTAIQAQYADVAERYMTTEILMPGDVVSIDVMGDGEVCRSRVNNDFNVFGVISTNPGIELNSTAGDDNTHPYVALSGRTPCNVIGPVKKGDRLVSSDTPGYAMVNNDADYRAVIGRALHSSSTSEKNVIEIVIGLK